jgi:two-component system response regulator YesN
VRILIVDDDEVTVESLRAILDLEGHDVEVATRAQTALEQMKVFHPDVMITDAVMPGMGGVALIDAARRTDPACRFVLVSGHDPGEFDAERIGAAIVAKPIVLSELLAVVSRRPS